jgi:hypothetical protein
MLNVLLLYSSLYPPRISHTILNHFCAVLCFSCFRISSLLQRNKHFWCRPMISALASDRCPEYRFGFVPPTHSNAFCFFSSRHHPNIPLLHMSRTRARTDIGVAPSPQIRICGTNICSVEYCSPKSLPKITGTSDLYGNCDCEVDVSQHNIYEDSFPAVISWSVSQHSSRPD